MNSNEHHLLDDLKQWFPSFTCTLQDLRAPTEEFVTSFYSFWLSDFEVNIASLPQIQFRQLQHPNVCRYSDSYSSTIPKLNLLRAIQTFNVVPDFGLLDIVSPAPKRTQTVIRAFCEFYMWCDQRMGSMRDMKKEKKIRERKKLLLTMMQEKKDLEEELNNTFKTIGQLQDVNKEMEVELNKYLQMASELKVEKDVLKTKTDEANEKIKEKNEILKKIAKDDSQITNKIKEYSNQVVNSPTAALSDLDTLREKNKEMKNLSERERDMVESKMKAQKTLEEVLRLAEENAVQLEEVLKVIEHKRKLLQVVSDIEKMTVTHKENLEELKSLHMSVVSQKDSHQDKLQALNLKWKTTKEQLTLSLDAAKSMLENQKSTKNQMMASIKEDAKLEENISSIIKKIKAHGEAFQREYERLQNQQKSYIERLQKEGIVQMQKAEEEVEKNLNNKNKKKSKK